MHGRGNWAPGLGAQLCASFERVERREHHVSERFRGFPVFLREAAEALRLPGACQPAGRNLVVAAIANLCSQAEGVDRSKALSILEEAQRLLDQLRVATLGAEKMIGWAVVRHGEESRDQENVESKGVSRGPEIRRGLADSTLRAGGLPEGARRRA